jgi:protein tyrosine phosphatase (PTP) superfamily phosphohydrolase (DUF442 family)
MKLTAALVLATFAIALHAQPSLEVISRIHHYTPLLSTAGMPKREHFAALAAAGYQEVISLVPGNAKEERELVESLGMRFHHVPVDWSSPRVEDLVQAVHTLERHPDRKVFLHCTANARASAIAYLHRTTRLGLPEAEERATLVRIWRGNRGFELENQPHWQFLVEEARDMLRAK